MAVKKTNGLKFCNPTWLLVGFKGYNSHPFKENSWKFSPKKTTKPGEVEVPKEEPKSLVAVLDHQPNDRKLSYLTKR